MKRKFITQRDCDAARDRAVVFFTPRREHAPARSDFIPVVDYYLVADDDPRAGTIEEVAEDAE